MTSVRLHPNVVRRRGLRMFLPHCAMEQEGPMGETGGH